jgi:L-asparaginase/Glu-tRNA(Gln) amidotransferase subunit D
VGGSGSASGGGRGGRGGGRGGAASDTPPGASLSAGDLNAQKARIRLMLALVQATDPAEIARLFREQ